MKPSGRLAPRSLAPRALRKLAALLDRGKPEAPVLDISNWHVNWLLYAIPGWQNRGNLYCFDHAIGHLPSEAPVVEIGSFCGLSTNLMSYYKRKHGARNPLITCDRWEFEDVPADAEIEGLPVSLAEYREFIKQTYIRNIQTFSRDDLPFTIEMLSDEFFPAWRAGAEARDVMDRPLRLGGPVSFCFIDGNHNYDYAKRDFEHVDEFLERGGFILFDDSADGSGWGVCDVVKEVQAAGRYELVAKNPNYLFRKK